MHAEEMDRQLAAMQRQASDHARETALSIGLLLGGMYVASLPRDPSGYTPKNTQILLAVLAILPLLAARRWPALAAAGAALITVATLRVYDTPVSVASFCVTLFVLGNLVVRRGVLLAVPLLLPFVVLTARQLDGHSALPRLAPLLVLVAALVAGESLRKNEAAAAALDATEEAMAVSVRAQTAMEERARIARELHDIVAHHLTVIALESDAARLTSPELSAEAGGRLEAIASTAREALTETRRLLGVLREDTGHGADRAPQPGLGDLDELVGKARATGTAVRLRRRGEAASLPRSIDLAAYRIVQEALTNARRHAPGADVDVDVDYGERALHLRVRDTGPGVPGGEPVAGHGLLGMRERALLAGGTFAAGSAVGGGFEVDVTLPTTEAPR